MSLSVHNKVYQMSWGNLFSSVITGASGFTYAKRHYELSKLDSRWIAHRLIALIEFMPVLGGIAATVERLTYALFGSDSIAWRTSPVTSQAALEKMIKNQNKALAEHYDSFKSYFGNPYLSSMSLSADDLAKKEPEKLKLTHHFADAQGPRPTMEDAHFYKEMEKGVLTGVFDGHGGSEVSAYASAQFQQRFPKALKQTNGNVHEAFEKVIHQIHQKVANHSAWNDEGSTAVVCYIDNETHQVFTATLGDSEANIYRKTGWGGLSSIPLSCVRDWLSTKDIERLYDIYGVKHVRLWMVRNGCNAKYIRSHLYGGVNVSRAIGDVANTGEPGQPRVIHKPKITVNKLKAGDKLILACDGLKDFLPENGVVGIVNNHNSQGLCQRVFGSQSDSKSLAQQLVDSALKRMDSRSNDNVTIVVVEVA